MDAVEPGNWQNTLAGTGDERLVGRACIIGRDIRFAGREAQFLSKFEDGLARNPPQAPRSKGVTTCP